MKGDDFRSQNTEKPVRTSGFAPLYPWRINCFTNVKHPTSKNTSGGNPNRGYRIMSELDERERYFTEIAAEAYAAWSLGYLFEVYYGEEPPTESTNPGNVQDDFNIDMAIRRIVEQRLSSS